MYSIFCINIASVAINNIYKYESFTTDLVKIEEGVREPRRREHPEAHHRSAVGRQGCQIERPHHEKGQDVFHVVEVGSPHSLHALVAEGDLAGVHLGVLGVGKNLVWRSIVEFMFLNGMESF